MADSLKWISHEEWIKCDLIDWLGSYVDKEVISSHDSAMNFDFNPI